MHTVKYDGNGSETYTLLFNQIDQAELLLHEDGAIEMTQAINSFLEQASMTEDILYIRNDDEMHGVIVDIWNTSQTELIDSCCFWFDDFK